MGSVEARHCIAVLLVSISAFLSSCTKLEADEPPPPPGTLRIHLGSLCYHVPEWNPRFSGPGLPLPGFGGGTSARSTTLQFSNADLARQVAGYQVPLTVQGKPLDGLSALVFLRTAEDARVMGENKKKMHVDLWYAQGDWPQRTVEFASEYGFYRVFWMPRTTSWMVVTTPPDMERRDSHLKEDFWIATCGRMSWGDSCKMTLTDSATGIVFDIDTPEHNVPLRGEIGRYLASTLDSWKAPCE